MRETIPCFLQTSSQGGRFSLRTSGASPSWPQPLARILKLPAYLLPLAPDGYGEDHVQPEFMTAADDAKLMEVASEHFDGFVCVCKLQPFHGLL